MVSLCDRNSIVLMGNGKWGQGVTEAEARAALRAFVGVGGFEQWIADQRWERIHGGWNVRGQLHSWRFRLEPSLGGLRIVMAVRGGEPAVWTVPVVPHRRSQGD